MNLVTFKRYDGIKHEKLYILGVHWKIRLLGGGGSRKTNIERGIS